MTALLHTHSYYSLLRGIPSPKELAEAAGRAGFKAIALSDHQRLSGAIEFYEACKEQGLKPILGLDLKLSSPLVEPISLVLLATTLKGWGNLCSLSSVLLNQPGFEDAPLSFDDLQNHHEDLICMSAAPFGALDVGQQSQPLNTLRELFTDRLYLRLSRIGAHYVSSLANSLKLPIVADWPLYYLSAEDAELQRVVTAMRLNTTVANLPVSSDIPLEAHFPSKKELEISFSAWPESLAMADEVASRCNLSLPLGESHFPELDLPEGTDIIETLRQKAYAGAKRLYSKLSPEIINRLEHELEGIQNSGYTSLFLIMEEIISFASQADVPSSSRGSAASSLVAHCLGITTPDPMRHNLYFERFLNPERHSPPDIDTDLCSRRRDIVIQHVYERYGAERVAMVATINRLRRRSSLREVAKVHGLSPAEIKKLVDTLPHRYWGPPGALPGKKAAPYADLAEKHTDENHQRIFRQAEALLDFPHHLSIHPGGVVISPGKLKDLVPTQLANKGVVITQFDLHGVERIGLVKIDLLGIRGLTVLGDVADWISQKQPDSGKTRLEVLDSIPDNDSAAAEMIQSGRTIGCFQIESPGMRATIKEIGSKSIDDVMVALALFRPGPLKGGLKEAFVRRHKGIEPVSHLHPGLEPLLAETHGVILYQEQVLRIAHELAGFSLAESDLLRRAMSHFDPGKQMRTLKQKFLTGAKERSGLPLEIAERLWDLMAAFAGYGFPKAHAASYALIAWRSAWCKSHYPAEFMAAVLANWGGYYGQEAYLMEARRMGLKLHPPHINYSQTQFSVSYIDGEAHLFMGLDQLRDLTRKTQRKIIDFRPFGSLADFLTRVYPRKKEARNLIEVAALEGLGTIPDLLDQLDQGRWRRDQLPLFESEYNKMEDWTDSRKALAQERLLGVSLVAHPLESYTKQIAAIGAVSTAQAEHSPNRELRLAGMRQTWRRARRANGSNIYFMDLADLEGTVRVVIGEEVFLRCRSQFAENQALVVTGRLEEGPDTGEPLFRASDVQRLENLIQIPPETTPKRQ